MAVVHLRIRESLAELDDEFPDGEQHFRVPLDSAQIVEAFTLNRDGTRPPAHTAPEQGDHGVPELPRPGTNANPGRSH